MPTRSDSERWLEELIGNNRGVTTQLAPSADVSADAHLGENTKVWHLAQIRENAELGEGCIIGRGAYIGAGVTLGSNCKVQNYALVYEPAVVESGVFIGPAVVLTNDRNPRAVNSDGSAKAASDWDPVGVKIAEGASIGARAVCVAPVQIGRWAMVSAGAVVVEDVPDFALVVGVPARRIGWVGHSGHRLAEVTSGAWSCPVSGRDYSEVDGQLIPQTESSQ